MSSIILVRQKPARRQRAKKVLSDSPELVDFAIGLVNSVFNLPHGQVMFYEEFEKQKNKTFWGLVEMTSGLEGGVRVCGIAVLGYFWCGFAVIFFSKHGNAVFKVQAVRGNFKFYVAVIGEKIVVSR